MYRPRPIEAVATARRQRSTLGETSHRPWPLPKSSWFMGQSWRHLLFAHWRVDADELRRVIPPQLPLDLREGEAYVGVTPFRVEGFRLRSTPPAPVVSRFLEVNVRTYVNYGGKPGIYFLSLDADSRSAVAGARKTYRLPYFHARQELWKEAGQIQFRSRRTTADGPATEFKCAFEPGGEAPAEPGSLEHWLTERYCLYTLAEGGTVQSGEIHHPPWPLQHATAAFPANTMTRGYGLELLGEPLLHYSELQDVLLWAIRPLAGDAGSPARGRGG